jgi:hypothetical protein
VHGKRCITKLTVASNLWKKIQCSLWIGTNLLLPLPLEICDLEDDDSTVFKNCTCIRSYMFGVPYDCNVGSYIQNCTVLVSHVTNRSSYIMNIYQDLKVLFIVLAQIYIIFSSFVMWVMYLYQKAISFHLRLFTVS